MENKVDRSAWPRWMSEAAAAGRNLARAKYFCDAHVGVVVAWAWALKLPNGNPDRLTAERAIRKGSELVSYYVGQALAEDRYARELYAEAVSNKRKRVRRAD